MSNSTAHDHRKQSYAPFRLGHHRQHHRQRHHLSGSRPCPVVFITASLDHRFELQQQQFQLQQERMDASVSEIRELSGADVREIRQLIQASEANRHADARAINARVDVAEQLILASHSAPEISSRRPPAQTIPHRT